MARSRNPQTLRPLAALATLLTLSAACSETALSIVGGASDAGPRDVANDLKVLDVTVDVTPDVADVADVADDVDNDADDTGDLLGELVDMVLVGADDSDSRHPEVHLQFKADVFGGLHLQLQKTPEGLVATFSVADAAARRAVVDQVDGLLVHLKQRGFSIVRHSVDVASS